jgi:hypothetical protein
MEQKQRLRELLVRRSDILKQFKNDGNHGNLATDNRKPEERKKRGRNKRQRVVLLADLINDSTKIAKENFLPQVIPTSSSTTPPPHISSSAREAARPPALSLPALSLSISPSNEPMMSPKNGLHLLAAAASKYLSPTSHHSASLFVQKRKGRLPGGVTTPRTRATEQWVRNSSPEQEEEQERPC